MPDFAKIRIQLPKGCNRKALTIHSLDRRSRELAFETFIFADGKQLLCTAFKVNENGTLGLTVAPECFEIEEVASRGDQPTCACQAIANEFYRFRPGELRPGRIPNSGRTFIHKET